MLRLLKWALDLFKSAKVDPSVSISIPLGSGYDINKPVERSANKQLSDHFSLFEMTITSDTLAQKQNRMLSDNQIQKLEILARHAEVIRKLCGSPVYIHSGYRCDSLNKSTVGSSSTSQHPKCEAIDFDVNGRTVEDTFTLLVSAARQGKLHFGQLILEKAERSYGSIQWIHCSVAGSLPTEKVGQIMKMKAEADGKPTYFLVERIGP